jgi:DNA-3-methyladenine glycosylase I
VTEAPVSSPASATGSGAGDDIPRCSWTGIDPEYRRYHDEEWGFPLHGDGPLFEKISLEAFQAGLSWITILKRRPAFRSAFYGFDMVRVAEITDDEIEELMADTSIIRNRAKILATRSNARVARDLTMHSPGALNDLIWSFVPAPQRQRPRSASDIPAITPESRALSDQLRSIGFKFVGPTTMYALMQSAGLVDDHVEGCWRTELS